MARTDARRTGKQPTGATSGFHFAGLTAEETRVIRSRLNDVARTLGYISHSGPLSGRGNAAALLVAIARGEVVVMRKNQEEIRQGERTDSSIPAA